MASQIIHSRVFIVLFSSKDENIGIMKQTRSTHVEDMSKSHKIVCMMPRSCCTSVYIQMVISRSHTWILVCGERRYE